MAGLYAVAVVDVDLASPLTWLIAVLVGLLAAMAAWRWSARFGRSDDEDTRPLPLLIFPVNGVVPEPPPPAPRQFQPLRAITATAAFVLSASLMIILLDGR